MNSLKSPREVLGYQHLPVAGRRSADPDRGRRNAGRDLARDGLHDALDDDRERARVGHGAGIVDDLAGGLAALPLNAETAVRVDRLRHKPDMSHDRYAALHKKRDRRSQRRARFQLDAVATGFPHDPGGVAVRPFGRFLVRSERHVDDDASAPRAARHRGAVRDHHLQRDRQRVFQPVEHHAERVADKQAVDVLVEYPCRRGGVGGQNDDGIAALARRQFRRCNALDPAWGSP